MAPTFRSRVAESSLTLPLTALLAVFVWLYPDATDKGLWAALLATEATAYVAMEWNNRHTLLRIRSRMVSTLFLICMAACPMLHTLSTATFLPLCLVLTYTLLFYAYQKVRCEGEVFHAFLFLGIGVFLFPPLAVLIPVLHLTMLLALRTLTWRTWLASWFGILLPLWLYAAWAVWENRLDTAFLYVLDYLPAGLPDFAHTAEEVGKDWLYSFGFFAYLTLLSTWHFLRTSYNDKIRTRMFYYTIITVEVVLLAGTVLLPQHKETMLPLLLVNSSPLIAHYYTLARGRLMEFWFHLHVLALLALALFNHAYRWMPSLLPL